MRNLGPVLLIVLFALVTAYGIFAMANLQSDFYWMPIGLVGFMASIFWALIFRGMLRNWRILKNGEAATATVLRISGTGVYVNHNPQVKLEIEVTPARGSSYITTTKVVAPRLNPMMFGPGSIVPIKIDPNDPLAVAVDKKAMRDQAHTRQGSSKYNLVNAQRQAAMQDLVGGLEQMRTELMANGKDGEGTIQSLWSMDTQVGAAVAMAFLVDVEIPGKASFRSEIKCLVPNSDLGRYSVGARVAVKYDPVNPFTRISIAGVLPQ